jgi:hypothetical protein
MNFADQPWRSADGAYKVIHDGGRWWDLPYMLYGPSGAFISCFMTPWFARRAIARERARVAREVYREPA